MKKTIRSMFYHIPYLTRFIRTIMKRSKLMLKYRGKQFKHWNRTILRKFGFGKKPLVLQFPITYKCNFDCVMCGMQKMSGEKDMHVADLMNILSDELFSELRSVGVNGGEPFLVSNIDEYVSVLLSKLPKLENIYIITNGYLTDRILNKLEIMKKACTFNDVKLTVSVSVDGIDSMQDKMRGRDNIFSRIQQTCLAISEDRNRYCDRFGVICTITKMNLHYLNEVDVWAEKHHIPISYNIATVHERLFNRDRYDQFSVLTDDYTKTLATEWFYSKFRQTGSEPYYGLYRYLLEGKRVSDCDYQYNGMTLLPNGDISYCATCSKVVGNSMTIPAYRLYYENEQYKEQLIADKCNTCSHYSGAVSTAYYKEYVDEILRSPFKFRI